MGALSDEQKNKRNADFNALFNSLTPVPSADTSAATDSGAADSGAADTGVAADTGTAPVSTGTRTTTTVSTTTAPKTELEKAAERAETTLQTVASARERASEGRSTLRSPFVTDASTRAAAKRKVAKAEAELQPFKEGLATRGDPTGAGVVTAPVPPSGLSREAMMRGAVARIQAKQEQIAEGVVDAVERKASKIAELAALLRGEARDEPQSVAEFVAAGASRTGEARMLAGRKSGAEGDEADIEDFRPIGLDETRATQQIRQEIDDLDQFIINLKNLDENLVAIREKSLGNLKPRPQDVAAAKEQLRGKPLEFDPEVSRQSSGD